MIVPRETANKNSDLLTFHGGTPLVVGYHHIWIAYGWWLPYDPRGSTSREILIERIADHPVWGGPGWKVFLNTRADMEHIVSYIENNPIKARRPAQHWFFVARYDGWMPAPAFR